MEASDLTSLSPEDRGPVLDAICEGAEFPMVLVEGRLVCTEGTDAVRVMEAVDLALGQQREAWCHPQPTTCAPED